MKINSKLFKHLLGKLSLLVPYLVLFTFLALGLETIKFPGFFKKYFFIDAKMIFAFTLTLLILVKNKSRLLSVIFRVNRFLFPLFTISYIVLNAIEGAKYTNYVLGAFHVHLNGLTLLVLFSFSLFLIGKFDLKPVKVKKMKVTYPVAIFLVTVFLVKNISYTIDESFKRDFYILFHPTDTYDQKMFYYWEKFYDYMVFVKANTPEDATILLPPMKDPWLQGAGNPHFVRAFLFPRKLIQMEDVTIADPSSYPAKTYILITWGGEECEPEGCHGWPRQDIQAKTIVYKDPGSASVIQTKTDTIYKLEDDEYVYGIIEL